MARLAPKIEILRALFSRSGNQCAFSGCSHPIVNSKNKFIAQVCHIEAAKEGAERYNSKSNDEYRRSYENLIIFCYRHHIETDDVSEYTVSKLIEMKNEHEQMFEKSDFRIDEAELRILSFEMEKYWDGIERLNKVEHIFSDSGLAMEVNGENSFFEVIASAHDAVKGIENILKTLRVSDECLKRDFVLLLSKKGVPPELFDDIPYYKHPFENRNWETHNLGTPNWLQRLRIDLAHIEVKYLEEYLKTSSDDRKARSSFEKAKELLKKYAVTAMHVD